MLLRDPGKWRPLLIRETRRAALMHPRVAKAGKALPKDAVVCEHCGEEFQRKSEMYSHMMHRHGYRNPLCYLVRGGRCGHCGKDFHERARLLKHLRWKREVNACAAWQGRITRHATHCRRQ